MPQQQSPTSQLARDYELAKQLDQVGPSLRKRSRASENADQNVKRKSTTKAMKTSIVRKPPTGAIYYPPQFSKWKAKRRQLWNNLDTDPDAYYFHYVGPSNGPLRRSDWSGSEKALLATLLRQRPPLGQWGLFSLNMPGRTGKQCQEQAEALQSNPGPVKEDEAPHVDESSEQEQEAEQVDVIDLTEEPDEPLVPIRKSKEIPPEMARRCNFILKNVEQQFLNERQRLVAFYVRKLRSIMDRLGDCSAYKGKDQKVFEAALNEFHEEQECMAKRHRVMMDTSRKMAPFRIFKARWNEEWDKVILRAELPKVTLKVDDSGLFVRQA